MSAAQRINRLIVFNHLWAIAGCCEWTRWRYTETGFHWVLLVTSLALGIFPSSVSCLALFAVAQILFTGLAANQPWNHGLFMAVINFAILVAIARCLREERQPDPETLVETFAPALRLSLICLYFMTFFHKLNADFVNPDLSCAGTLLGWMNRSYRVLPLDQWAVVASIWGTLFIESVVPVLLCFRRTVYVGLAIGAGFHLFLSQYSALYGFAAMLFAVYYLFLPRTFTAALAERVSALLRSPRWSTVRRMPRVVLPAAAVLLLIVGRLLGELDVSHLYRGLIFWDVWFLGVLVIFGRELARVWNMPADFMLRPRWAPFWVFPIVVVLNGLAPYVGLKTETSWAMYSNLRTEVRGNHFIVPAATKVFGYQDDLVEVLETSLPALQKYVGGDVHLTLFEFRRICSLAQGDFRVSYRLNGAERALQIMGGVASDPAICRAHPWLVGKLLRFRPVDTGAHATCRH